MKQNEIVHKNVIFIPSHNENNKSYIELLTHKHYDEDTMVTFVTFPACVSLRNRDLNSFSSLCGMKIFEP